MLPREAAQAGLKTRSGSFPVKTGCKNQEPTPTALGDLSKFSYNKGECLDRIVVQPTDLIRITK